MNFLINILFIIIIFFSKNSYAEKIDKIIFSIEDKYYTTIDLNKRIKYLEILSNKKIEEFNKEILNDYISVLIFDKYAIEKKIDVANTIIEEYFNNIINQYKINNIKKYMNLKENKILDKEIINKNIKLDYQRKLILEKLLDKNINKLKNNENELLNIYNIKIKYFSFNSNKDFNKFQDVIDFNNIKKTKEILDKNLINYIYYNKDIRTFKNLNKKIQKEIIQNNENFIIKENNIFIIGQIKKNVKNNIDLKYTFFKIDSLNKIDKPIKCHQLNNFKNNNRIKIKKYKDIEINKLNNELINNLKYRNDIIKINNGNKFTYIILCKLSYNEEITKKILLNQKVNKEVIKIEEEFLIQKKQDYKLQIYE